MKSITYTFDPAARSLTIMVDGKSRGGFIGPAAEQKFNELLLSGAEISISNMNAEQYKKVLIRNFHAALATQGIIQHKGSILEGYGVEHTTDLTIEQLKKLLETYSTNREKQATDTATIRRMRSDLLAIMQKIGVYVTNNDWSLVNNFCMKHTGKLLYQMTEEDMTKARRQFNSILDWQEQHKSEIERLKNSN